MLRCFRGVWDKVKAVLVEGLEGDLAMAWPSMPCHIYSWNRGIRRDLSNSRPAPAVAHGAVNMPRVGNLNLGTQRRG